MRKEGEKTFEVFKVGQDIFLLTIENQKHEFSKCNNIKTAPGQHSKFGTKPSFLTLSSSQHIKLNFFSSKK